MWSNSLLKKRTAFPVGNKNLAASGCPADKAQPPDQRKQAPLDISKIPVKTAIPQRGPPVIPKEDGYRFILYRNTTKVWSRQCLLRHEPNLLQLDGAVFCPKLMQTMYEPHPKTPSWCFDKCWTRYQMDLTGSDWNIVLTHAVTGTYHWQQNYRGIVEGWLIAGGASDRRGRQAFFSTMDPLEELLPNFKEFHTKGQKIDI